MRMSQFIAAARAFRMSALVFAVLSAGSGCSASRGADEEVSVGHEGKTGDKQISVVKDPHLKAQSMLDESGGGSDSGGRPYCDIGEAFTQDCTSFFGGSDDARRCAIRAATEECEAAECYDRGEGKVRNYDCPVPANPASCTYSPVWGHTCEATIHGR